MTRAMALLVRMMRLKVVVTLWTFLLLGLARHAGPMPSGKLALALLALGAGYAVATTANDIDGNTIQVAHDIPDHNYDHSPADGARTVRQMLTHVALSTRLWIDMHASGSTDITTFDFPAYGRRMRDAEAVARSKTEILDLLRKKERLSGRSWAGSRTLS